METTNHKNKPNNLGRERWEEDRKRQKEQDPCFDESNISLECQNTYGKDKCEREINNTRLCVAFWRSVEKYRRANHIFPFKPPPEEREKIKQEELERIRKELYEYKEKQEQEKSNYGGG